MAAGGRKHRKQGAETPETQWAKGAETPETGGGNSGNGVKHPLVLLLVLLRAHLEAGLGLSLGLLGGGFLAAGLQWAVLGQRTLRGLRKRVRPFIAEGGNTGNRGWKRRKQEGSRGRKHRKQGVETAETGYSTTKKGRGSKRCLSIAPHDGAETTDTGGRKGGKAGYRNGGNGQNILAEVHRRRRHQPADRLQSLNQGRPNCRSEIFKEDKAEKHSV